jgi:PPOX class probable F420-dependent enzyme
VLSILDPAREIDARALARVNQEQIAWFGTIGRDGFPHAVPVCFLPHDESILVLSEPATAKVRNLRENPHAFIHLEGGPGGEFLTMLQGLATVSERPASAVIDEIGSAYAAKYASGLVGIGLTVETMAAQYSCVIEFVPTKLIAW